MSEVGGGPTARGMHHGHAHRGGRQGGWAPVHDDPANPRLFFAVPIPEAARAEVAALADRVQAAVGDGRAHIRWVRMEGLHLTLRFLGPTPVATVESLAALAEAAAAATAPIGIELGGAGAFPSALHPRTLWVGLREGADRLERLAGLVEAGVAERLERPLDTRPFAPHLTIARTDGLRSAPAAARALMDEAEALASRFVADEVVLYRSILGDGPARYEPVHAARLSGA